jgi:hypothetical protein
VFEHGLPFVRAEVFHRQGGIVCRDHRLLERDGIGQGGARGDLARVLVDDVERLA